jgi:predicted ferric reductase
MALVWTWHTFWMVTHVLFVIVAFGPTFAFPGIAAMARKDPAHAIAYSKVIHFVEKRMTIPLAVGVPLLGTGLIYTAHIDLQHSEWLSISIILYIFAFFFALFVQLPTSTKMVRVLEQMPPGPPPPGATPPPEIEKLGKRLQFGGMYLTVSVVVILLLMVWQPGGAYS